MNAVTNALLLLSVAVTASAFAIGDQKMYEDNLDLDGRELQIQDDDGNRPPWLVLPDNNLGKDQRSEITDDTAAVQLPSDVAIQPWERQPSEQLEADVRDQEDGAEKVELAAEIESALEQRHMASHPCRSYYEVQECEHWNTERHCVSSFIVCLRYEDKRTSCARWVTKKYCRYYKRSETEESSVQSGSVEAANNEPKEDSVNTGDDQVITKEELKTAAANLRSESLISFRSVYDEKVVKAEKYDPPAPKPGDDVIATGDAKLTAVIVTVADGRRFAIAQGRELWNSKLSAVVNADHVTDEWKLVVSKNVQSSTVLDYVRASDSGKDSEDAAEKMMALD